VPWPPAAPTRRCRTVSEVRAAGGGVLTASSRPSDWIFPGVSIALVRANSGDSSSSPMHRAGATPEVPSLHQLCSAVPPLAGQVGRPSLGAGPLTRRSGSPINMIRSGEPMIIHF
jgi:hypothetical protein